MSDRMPLPRPRILVCYFRPVPHGGATGVAAWILEALRQDYAVTLLTSKPVDLNLLDRCFGASLTGSALQFRTMAPLVRGILGLDPDHGSIQNHVYPMRLWE